MVAFRLSITLSSELSGTIDSIRFESGAHVKADQLLLSLDSSVEKANLNSSQARLPAARAKFERYKNLYQKNSISRDQLDGLIDSHSRRPQQLLLGAPMDPPGPGEAGFAGAAR
jgi:multidrug efflux pump subunit AcrA (membrane-fusion protein)